MAVPSSGTNFTGTPDGREGWGAIAIVRQGYPAVYVVDQRLGAGASGYLAADYGPDRNVQRDNNSGPSALRRPG